MEQYDKGSLAAIAAVRRANAEFGFDLTKVLSADQWAVVDVDGRAEMVVYRTGMHALCLMAPDQERGSALSAALDGFMGGAA